MTKTNLVTKIRGTRQTLAKRLKFLLFALILCYSPLFYANAQTTITSFNQTGTTAATCQINGGPMTGASISGEIILANELDIPIHAFNGNTNITSVTAAGSILRIGYRAFYGSSATFTFNYVLVMESDVFRNSSGNITFNDVGYVNPGSFQNSSGNIAFNDVINISNRAFNGSSGDITFNNVTTIRTGAFNGSSSDVTFNNVDTIQANSFNGSSGDITFNSVETIQSGAFTGSSSKIYVSRKMTEEKMQEFYSIGGYQGTLEIIPRNTTHINKVNIKKGRLIIKPQE